MENRQQFDILLLLIVDNKNILYGGLLNLSKAATFVDISRVCKPYYPRKPDRETVIGPTETKKRGPISS